MKTASFPEQFRPVYQYVMKDGRPQEGNFSTESFGPSPVSFTPGL